MDRKYNRASIGVTSAFDAGTDVAQVIRDDIETTYSDEILASEEAQICRIDMVSASAFSVSFNPWETIDAKENAAGDYELEYEGDIEYIVFGGSEDITLTFCEVGWCRTNTKHYEVTVASSPSGTAITVHGIGGFAIPADENDKYHLLAGGYVARAENNPDYRFFVNGDGSIAVPVA